MADGRLTLLEPPRDVTFEAAVRDFFERYTGYKMDPFLEFNRDDWNLIFTDKSCTPVEERFVDDDGDEVAGPDPGGMADNDFYAYMGIAVYDKSINKYIAGLGIDHLSDEVLTDITKEMLKPIHVKMKLLSGHGLLGFIRRDLEYVGDVQLAEMEVFLAILGYLDMKINERARGCGTYMCYKILEPILNRYFKDDSVPENDPLGCQPDITKFTDPVNAKSPSERLRQLIKAYPDKILHEAVIKEPGQDANKRQIWDLCTLTLVRTDLVPVIPFTAMPIPSRNVNQAIGAAKRKLNEDALAYVEELTKMPYRTFLHNRTVASSQIPKEPGQIPKLPGQIPKLPEQKADDLTRSSPEHIARIRDLIERVLGARNMESVELASALLSDAALESFATAFTTRASDPINNYETFEFMGDSVVNRAVNSYLFVNMKEICYSYYKPVFSTLSSRLKSKLTLYKLAEDNKFHEAIVKAKYEKDENEPPHEYRLDNKISTRPKHLERTTEDMYEDVFEAFFGVLEKTVDTCIQDGAGYFVCEDIIWRMLDKYQIGERPNAMSIRYHDATAPSQQLQHLGETNLKVFYEDANFTRKPYAPKDTLFITYRLRAAKYPTIIYPGKSMRDLNVNVDGDETMADEYPKHMAEELASRALRDIHYKIGRYRGYPRIKDYKYVTIFNNAIDRLGRDTVKPI